MKHLILTLATLALSSTAIALDCHGTEPFWGATVSDSSIEIEMPGLKSTLSVNKKVAAAGYVEDFVSTYMNNNGPVATVIAKTCDNGMSDHDFPQEIVIYTATSVLYGCCGDGVLPTNGAH